MTDRREKALEVTLDLSKQLTMFAGILIAVSIAILSQPNLVIVFAFIISVLFGFLFTTGWLVSSKRERCPRSGACPEADYSIT